MDNRIFLAFFIFLHFACGNKDTQITEEIYRPVRFAKVIKASGNTTYTFSGTAQSREETKLSFKVAGKILAMHAKLGDRVQKGQLIATIDPADFTIQAEQTVAQEKGAQANLQSTESQLLIARSNYERVEQLYANNSVPLSEYEQAKSNFETAQSQYEATKTQLTAAMKKTLSAKNQVKYTRLIAPFDGVITEIAVEANEMVGSGNPVAILSSETQPEVNVGVPENYITKINKGQQVSVTFSVLPELTFEGTIEEVSYAPGTSPTYPVIVRLKDPGGEIRPGMSANVEFDFQQGILTPELYTIAPVKSIAEDGEGHFVFVLKRSEGDIYLAQKRSVEIGSLLETGFEIREGISEGELVATAGTKSLLDGMKVKLMEQ